MLRAVAGGDYFGIIVGFEIIFDVRLVLGVGDTDRVRRSFGLLESVRHGERDVLAIITDDIVLERRAPLNTNAFHPPSQDRAEDLSDIFAMQNSSHPRHFFGPGAVEVPHVSAGDL